jgi:hypothetical protein
VIPARDPRFAYRRADGNFEIGTSNFSTDAVRDQRQAPAQESGKGLYGNSNEEVAVWDVTWRVALLGAVVATDLLLFVRLAREELAAKRKRLRRRVRVPDESERAAWGWRWRHQTGRTRRFAARAIR